MIDGACHKCRGVNTAQHSKEGPYEPAALSAYEFAGKLHHKEEHPVICRMSGAYGKIHYTAVVAVIIDGICDNR